MTTKEAYERGIPSRTQPPEPVVCQFCGQEVYHEGIVFDGKVFIWHLQPPPRCTCQEAQQYWRKRDAEERRKAEDEQAAKEREARRVRIENLLGKSGIKKRFLQRTFENYNAYAPDMKRCLKTAMEYTDNFAVMCERGDGLYIEGTNGTGKTHLAAAITLRLISQGVPVVCKTSTDLLADIKKAFDKGETTEFAVLQAYKTVDLLIVDDLGKEQCTDWSMSTLYSIFNERYEDMKPTIITTNFSVEGLMRALTPRGYDDSKIRAIISRLRETSTVLTMKWTDYRSR